MLTICGLKKSYTGLKIFEEIDLEIPKKSIVTLTGKNGIGRTTLLNILGGISEFEGDVLLNEISLKYHFKDYLKLTWLISNDPFLYDYLTVSEMIDFIALLSNNNTCLTTAYKDNMIEYLELTRYKSVFIKNLSLGTKQKLSFIIGFLNNPKLVLIDEPFVNFDKTSMHRILDFIQDYVSQTESIVIFSTHSENKKINNIVTHNIHIHGSDEICFREVSYSI
ncbi:ABC transporter ATP-binding protein [Paenibacillus larvae]